MKCVCPMGGDRTCPDDCPLAVWANLSATDRKAQRKAIAEKLYKQNFTMEAIATQLGVSQATITRDLDNLFTVNKSKPSKTASNPKGAGRPRGKRQVTRRSGPTVEIEQKMAEAVLDQGKTLEQVTTEFGLPSVQHAKIAVAREEGRREPQIDRGDLSMTAQEKFDVAVKRYQHNLNLQFEQRVNDESKRRIDQIILPHWKQQIEQAKQLYNRRTALMNKETFNTIRRALHPDSRQSISDKKLGEAFDAFMALEKYLLNEKDSPTDFQGLPGNWDEWEQAKRAATAARKAKRAAKNAPMRH